MTMAEYIKREATIKAILDSRNRYYNSASNQYLVGRCDGLDIAAGLLRVAPAADVAPVVHGRWIHSRYEDCSEQFELVKCSQCNHEAYAMAIYVHDGNYCPNCGAKMDGGDSDAKSV